MWPWIYIASKHSWNLVTTDDQIMQLFLSNGKKVQSIYAFCLMIYTLFCYKIGALCISKRMKRHIEICTLMFSDGHYRFLIFLISKKKIEFYTSLYRLHLNEFSSVITYIFPSCSHDNLFTTKFSHFIKWNFFAAIWKKPPINKEMFWSSTLVKYSKIKTKLSRWPVNILSSVIKYISTSCSHNNLLTSTFSHFIK